MSSIDNVGHSQVQTDYQTTAKKNIKNGQTYGEPKLSDAAAEYYDSLKHKYGSMNFVLVASDKKQEAEAMKAGFAVPGKMTVLIDEEKIEKMAADEEYRAKIEGVIANAANKVASLGDQLTASGAKVKSFGMTIDDNGNAKYFAVLEESSKKQRERIAAKAEEKHEEKIKADRKERREKLKEFAEGKDDTVTINANSIEELIQKVSDHVMNTKADTMMTEQEKQVGQSFDFSV